LIRKGKRSTQLLTKARILLKADVSDAGEGWSDSRIGGLDTSIATVERTGAAGRGRVRGSPGPQIQSHSPGRGSSTARPEAKLIALTLSPAPEGSPVGACACSRRKVVELHIVERASDNTIGRTQKKTFLNLTARAMGDSARRQRGFVANMEDVLEVYQSRTIRRRPLVASTRPRSS